MSLEQHIQENYCKLLDSPFSCPVPFFVDLNLGGWVTSASLVVCFQQ